jgi:hypothetical protein
MPGQIIMSRDKSRIISIARGETGKAGKSLAQELALALARNGNKVCLMDSCHNHNNQEPPSGILPPLAGKSLVLYDLPLSYRANVICLGLDFISANGPGPDHLPETECYDFVLVDNVPGLDKKNISFCLEAGELILIMNSSRSCLSRNYVLLKTLKQNGYDQVPGILFDTVLNNVDPAGLARRFSDKCRRDFKMSLSYLGVIPEKPSAQGESGNNHLIMHRQKSSPDSKAFNDFIQNLSNRFRATKKLPNPFDFWESSLASLIKSNISEIFRQQPPQESDSGHEPAGYERDFLLDPEKPVRKETPKPCSSLDNKQNREQDPGPGEAVRDKPLKKTLRIGIICSDESLRSLLEDMFREKGLNPLNMMNGKHGSPDILVCSMDKPDKPYLDTLKKNAGIPCIWLSQYKKFSPPWTAGVRFVQILEKPFSLDNIYRAVEKAALNDA